MNLFEKTHIGHMEVKNHFVRSATYEGKATDDGRPTEAIKELYVKLANGDVGTIITSYSYITNYEQPAKNQLGIYDDCMVEDYQNIVDEVHENGSQIVMQIVHGASNNQANPETAKVLGPSAIEHPISKIIPQEMTKKDIQDVIQLFVDAAKRVKKAGFDGVQIHCAHGYLLSQFISPLFNQRTDEYGGSWENRVRIVVEIYQAIRNEVGNDYPIWIKMNSSDEEDGGLSEDDFIKMAQELSGQGMDCIEISGAQWKKHSLKDGPYYQNIAMKLSKLIDTPLILTGNVRTLNEMIHIVENSHVQFFGFSRPFMTNVNYIQTLK